MPETPRIGIVLPHRETLSKARSGAIGLCMRDFTVNSRFGGTTTIFGGTACDFDGISYRQLEGWQRWYLRDRTAYFAHFAKLAKAARLDLIEVQNRPSMVGFLRRRLPGKSFALHLHNDPQEMAGSATPRERRALLAQADAVVCVSSFVRRRFMDGLADGGDRVHVVHNGMDIAHLPAAQPKQKIVFFAGRLVRDKGIFELVKAFHLAADRLDGWTLIIAGDDKLGLFRGKVPEVARELAALGNRCVHAGMLGHAAVMAYFGRAGISVVPTLTQEPLGRAAQEAMACGSALIASGSGGMAEAVGEAGMIVNPVTPRALAGAMVELAQNDDKRRALQAAGAQRMAQHFDIRRLAGLLDDLREQAIDRRLARTRGESPVYGPEPKSRSRS